MLRTLVFDEPFSVKLRLEGQLNAADLPCLHATIADVTRVSGRRKLILDLGDLASIDTAGIEYLASLDHVRLATVRASFRNSFKLKQPETKRSRIRSGVCRLLCALLPSVFHCPCPQGQG